MPPVRTLGQFVEDEQLLPWISGTVAEIIRHAGRGAKEHGKQLKLAISCTSCKATKTCCWSTVVARLYEGVLIAGEILAYVANEEHAAANAFEEQFRERLSLRKKVGRRYVGALPRMVLVALEAWGRTDFRDHLRQLPWPTEADLARWGQPAG